MSLHAALRGHSCYEALGAIGDTVFTGNTGTNLCDFNILYVPALADQPEAHHRPGHTSDEVSHA